MHGIRDIRHIVADRLDAFCTKEQLDHRRARVRVRHHIGQEIAAERAVDQINPMIGSRKALSFRSIGENEAIDNLAKSPQRCPRYPSQSPCQLRHRADIAERDHTLHDAPGDATNAAKLYRRLPYRNDEAQIVSYRLPPCYQEYNVRFYISTHRGIGLVKVEYRFYMLAVVADERLYCIFQFFFYTLLEFSDHARQVGEIRIKRLDCVLGHF